MLSTKKCLYDKTFFQLKNKKNVDRIAKIGYLSLAMNEEIEFVLYCNETVELLEIENTEYGNLAFIRFEDGREDQVPLSRIEFLD